MQIRYHSNIGYYRLNRIFERIMNYRNDLYASCIEWELNKLTLQLCSAFKTNSQVPEKNKLKNLLPIRSVYGAYDINQKLDFKNPITNEYYEEILNPTDVDMSNEKREEARLDSIQKINWEIERYNISVREYEEKIPIEDRNTIKYWQRFHFDEWALNVVLDNPSLDDRVQDNVLGLVIINNENVYKMALIIQTQEEFVAKFNKMIYDYLCIIIPQGELDDNHIYKNPIIEYENWFMINGLYINRTPSLMDEPDSKFARSPLALKNAEMEEENKALNYELFNAKRLLKKKSVTIAKLTRAKPEDRIQELLRNDKLQDLVDKKCRFRSGDRKVNYTALGRELGCSDNHAKTLLKKYAFYLIKDDEMGYTI